jgi:hypothetical protein
MFDVSTLPYAILYRHRLNSPCPRLIHYSDSKYALLPFSSIAGFGSLCCPGVARSAPLFSFDVGLLTGFMIGHRSAKVCKVDDLYASFIDSRWHGIVSEFCSWYLEPTVFGVGVVT